MSEHQEIDWLYRGRGYSCDAGGRLQENCGPNIAITDDELQVLAETLGALRGEDQGELEKQHGDALSTASLLCKSAAKLALASDRGNLRACDRLLLDLLEMYSNGELLDQEVEASVRQFQSEVKLLHELTDQLESMQPDQLKALKEQLIGETEATLEAEEVEV